MFVPEASCIQTRREFFARQLRDFATTNVNGEIPYFVLISPESPLSFQMEGIRRETPV